MKIRSGFVSNSSSSSFVLMATKEAFDAALAACTQEQRDYVSSLIGGGEKFLGREIKTYSYFSDNGGYSPFDDIENPYDDEDIENYEELRDALSDFGYSGFVDLVKEKATELGEGVFEHEEDW